MLNKKLLTGVLSYLVPFPYYKGGSKLPVKADKNVLLVCKYWLKIFTEIKLNRVQAPTPTTNILTILSAITTTTTTSNKKSTVLAIDTNATNNNDTTGTPVPTNTTTSPSPRPSKYPPAQRLTEDGLLNRKTFPLTPKQRAIALMKREQLEEQEREHKAEMARLKEKQQKHRHKQQQQQQQQQQQKSANENPINNNNNNNNNTKNANEHEALKSKQTNNINKQTPAAIKTADNNTATKGLNNNAPGVTFAPNTNDPKPKPNNNTKRNIVEPLMEGVEAMRIMGDDGIVIEEEISDIGIYKEPDSDLDTERSSSVHTPLGRSGAAAGGGGGGGRKGVVHEEEEEKEEEENWLEEPVVRQIPRKNSSGVAIAAPLDSLRKERSVKQLHAWIDLVQVLLHIQIQHCIILLYIERDIES